MLLAHSSLAAEPHHLLGGAVRSDTAHHQLCKGSADTGFGRDAAMSMATDAESLLEGGCGLACETWAAAREALGWTNGGVDRTFCHLVGAAHRDRLYQALGLDPTRDFSTFDFLGNVGSASLPLTMAMGIERNPPRPGEKIAMLGIGSGLSSVMLGLEW